MKRGVVFGVLTVLVCYQFGRDDFENAWHRPEGFLPGTGAWFLACNGY